MAERSSWDTAPVERVKHGTRVCSRTRDWMCWNFGVHTCVLFLPSLHFLECDFVDMRVFVSDDKISPTPGVLSFSSHFESPITHPARILQVRPILSLLNNLEYLAVSHSGRIWPPFQFPTCPTLRRLHVEYPTVSPSRIVTAYSWETITHLRASLTLRRQDLYAILARCVNMASCSVTLDFWSNGSPANTKAPTCPYVSPYSTSVKCSRRFEGIYRRFHPFRPSLAGCPTPFVHRHRDFAQTCPSSDHSLPRIERTSSAVLVGIRCLPFPVPTGRYAPG